MQDDTQKEEEINDQGDVVFEEENNESATLGGDPAAKVKKLKAELKAAKEEAQKNLDGWQRERAENINRRKRDEEERSNFAKFANEGLIADILPALDNFDLAMGNKEAWEKADKNWRMGIEYIYSQLLKSLENYGLQQTNPMGEVFMAAKHEPTEAVPVDVKENDGKIVAVLQKGYTLNGKLIRPAKVKVGEYKA